MTIGSGSGGGLSISTTKLFESKPLRINALTCKGATPTATITPTPGFDYSGELQVIPDVVYGGACPVGLPSLDLFAFFRPVKAPDVAKPPVPVKYYAQLDFIAPSGGFYPSVMGLMSWSGAPDNHWYFGLPLLLASWPPAYEDGLISVTVGPLRPQPSVRLLMLIESSWMGSPAWKWAAAAGWSAACVGDGSAVGSENSAASVGLGTSGEGGCV